MRTLTLCLAAILLAACGTDGGPPAFVHLGPAPRELIAVANRGDGTLSVIDPATDTVVQTAILPAGTRPVVPGYVAFSAAYNRLYIGDEANRRVLVLRADDCRHVASLPMEMDTFHLWLHGDQLWAVDRLDRSVAAFNIAGNTRLAVVPIPADLAALGGVPHDVVVDTTHAYVTILNVAGGGDVVVQYSRTTFSETARAVVGEDPHVFLHPSSPLLYVACQDTDNVFVLGLPALDEITVIPILGGHGVWVPAHGETLYVTNFPGHVPGGNPGPGALGVFAVDLTTNTSIGGVAAPSSAAHNLASPLDGRKLYVTHSNGGTKVSVYDLPTPSSMPVFLRQIDVGANPFGIAHFVQ